MGSIFSRFESSIMKFGEKLSANIFLKVLRDAFMISFPLVIFGSITLVIANFPFLDKILGAQGVETLKGILGPASTATMSISTVFIVIGIGYYYSKEKEVEPIFGAAIALSAFILLTPSEVPFGETGEVVGNVLSIDRLGAKGMFVGMMGSFIAAMIYTYITNKNWTIKMPPSVPAAVSKSFAALIPAVITLSIFLGLRTGFAFTPWGNVHDFIYEIIQAPLVSLGSGIIPTLIAILIIQVLWFFGLHGQIIVNSVMDPIWNTLSLENLEAFQVGAQLPNIVNKQFIEIFFVGLGGTGLTLAVVIAILMFMKSKQLREIGKLAAPAGIFNVNEPVTFGLPIVLNPIIAIPWIVAPLVSTAVAYFAMSSGLVPATTGVAVPWTTPIFLNGMLATNSIMGGVLQLLQLLIVFAIWFPFLKALDKNNLKKEQEVSEEDDISLDDVTF